MDNIQFQEDTYTRNHFTRNIEPKGFSGFLINNGIAKDTKTANIIMIILALCVFGISIYFFVYGFNAPVAQGPVQQERATSFSER